MSELNYWTGNLVTGDDIFYVRDDKVLFLAVVTGVTDTTFCISGTDAHFDKLTARNPEGLSALPYDTEHRDAFLSQHQRARLTAMNFDALSDNQVTHMLGGLNLANDSVQVEQQRKGRERLKAIDVKALSDKEVAYMLAGLKLAEKPERVNRNENHHALCDPK